MKRATNADKAEIIRKRVQPPVSKEPPSVADQSPHDLSEGEKVSLLIGEETDLGFKALINNDQEGILYKNEVFQPLATGQRIDGFIKKIREDEKIDLSLYRPGYKKVDGLSERVISRLKTMGGFIPVTDKSDPLEIYELFGVSKKTYKMIVGQLYKKRIIDIEDGGIRLVKKAQGARKI